MEKYGNCKGKAVVITIRLIVMGTVSVLGRYEVNVQSILACPLMQLGDGDGGGERGGGWKQEGARRPDQRIPRTDTHKRSYFDIVFVSK
jgi:hypothetical protein